MNNPTPKHCPRCGAGLPAGATGGVCPRCAANLLQATQTEIPGEGAGAFTPPTVAELAAKFPQLEIIELIGRGGMGAVYKARQKELDRLVALKILPPDIGQDAAFAGRFSREAKALAKLNHPGIVTIYDFGRADGLYFFLMEFVDGMNLRELLHNGRISPREALAIVPQICDALQFAHDQGIVHRDIKPENLLMDRRGRVKVADFGLAKLVGGEPEPAPAPGAAAESPAFTEAGKVMGTPHYMSPEQMERPGEVDHRADIYALGVVFYQMLTGELPGQQLQPPSSKVRIDVRLDEVVLRALEKKPERRYQQASVLKTQVETIAGGPAAARPGSLLNWHRGLDYKSKATLFGLPVLHVTSGLNPETGRVRVSRGIIAIGGIAQGVVACGGVAMGGIAFGGLSLGIFAYGGLAIGLLALGGLALGLLGALGGGAAAPIAVGGLAAGVFAKGGLALGRHTVDALHQDPAAVKFFGQRALALLLSHFQILNFSLCAVVLVVCLGVPWCLRPHTRPGAKRLALVIAAVVSIIVPLLALCAIFYLPIPTNAIHPVQTDQPFELKQRPTAGVIAAGLAEPDQPWAWQELESRLNAAQLSPGEANQLVSGLTAWLSRDYPHGYNQWLAGPGVLLEDLGNHGLVAKTNELAFLRAYYGGTVMEPLPRLRANETQMPLKWRFRSPWNDGLFGLTLLSYPRAITIDGRPAPLRDDNSRSWTPENYGGNLDLPALALGRHVLHCEIARALVAKTDATGLAYNAPPQDWPPAEMQWTEVCDGTFTVYPRDATNVTLADDPALNPVTAHGLSVRQIIIRHKNDHLRAVISFHMNPTLGTPLSLKLTLRCAGKSVPGGNIWLESSADGKSVETGFEGESTGDGQGTTYDMVVDLDALDPQIKTADVIFSPDPDAVESHSQINRIWGRDVIFSKVPLTRLDVSGENNHSSGAGTTAQNPQWRAALSSTGMTINVPTNQLIGPITVEIK